MSAPAPPTIIIDTPNTTPSLPPTAPPAQQTPQSTTTRTSPKPLPPSIDTTPIPSPTTHNGTAGSIFNRRHAATTTPAGSAACYLCEEQNPGDFSPTTKYLEACLLCNRYFCPIHKSLSFNGCCDINHSTYFHVMLGEAHRILNSSSSPSNSSKVAEPMSPTSAARALESRDLAEVLIQEGIYPSLGEREKAIFATSPVDERKQRELETFRSLDAAVMNGGERGRRELVEEKDFVGADVAV